MYDYLYFRTNSVKEPMVCPELVGTVTATRKKWKVVNTITIPSMDKKNNATLHGIAVQGDEQEKIH
jgi:hypothetical protein